MPVIPVAVSDSRNAPARAPMYTELWWADTAGAAPATRVVSAPVVAGRAEFPALPAPPTGRRWAVMVREMGVPGPLLRTGPLAHLPVAGTRLGGGLSVFRGGPVSFGFSGDYAVWLRRVVLERLAPLAPALGVRDAAFGSVQAAPGDWRLEVTLTSEARPVPFLRAEVVSRHRYAIAPETGPGRGPAVRVTPDGAPDVSAAAFVTPLVAARVAAAGAMAASAVAEVVQGEMTGEIVPSLAIVDDLRFTPNTVAAGRAAFGLAAGVDLVVNPGQIALRPGRVLARD